ncbi:MAG: type 4a pilus biogenesis protein PilO [Nannocystaceae bacterium]
MASAFESLEKVPIWQRLLLWVLVSAAIVAVWYFMFYTDSVEARVGAERGLDKAKIELTRLEEKKANYLEELRKNEERKAKLAERTEILPMSSSTVDNLMQTFQQKARQVGMSFDSWTNESEERQDVYARLPVKVAARGTWPQVGEFFRELSTLKQPVSIENLELTIDNDRDEAGESPSLGVQFEAATYRALSEEERSAPSSGRQGPSRRKGAGK